MVQSNVSGKPQSWPSAKCSANSYYPPPLTPLIGAQLRARVTVLYVKTLLEGRDYLALARRLRRRLFSSTKTHEKGSAKARLAAHA